MTFQGKLAASRRDFESLVWPAIADDLGGGELLGIEGTAGYLGRTIDTVAGIDFFQYYEWGLRGIAQRTQPWGKCWGTFTIRETTDSGQATELRKRIWQVDRRGLGVLSPGLTIQAYVTPDHSRLLCAAAIHTDLLIGFLRTRKEGQGWYRDEPREGDATFIVVRWQSLIDSGRPVKVWRLSADAAA